MFDHIFQNVQDLKPFFWGSSKEKPDTLSLGTGAVGQTGITVY